MSKRSNNFEIFKQADFQSSAAEAGECLNTFLAENKKLPVLLMLSGGSCLSIIDYVGMAALGANLTVSMLDERFTPLEVGRQKGVRFPDVASGNTSNGVNNFIQLQKTDFYKDAFEAEASFFGSVPRNGENAEDLRQRWDKNLKTWRAKNPQGLIIATLGMGPDGHTAGIFPFPEDPDKFDAMFSGGAWTVAYNASVKNKFPERVTTTLTFLKMVDFGFAFVAGAEKKESFVRLTSADVKTAELPAAVWREMKNVRVFTPLEVGRP